MVVALRKAKNKINGGDRKALLPDTRSQVRDTGQRSMLYGLRHRLSNILRHRSRVYSLYKFYATYIRLEKSLVAAVLRAFNFV